MQVLFLYRLLLEDTLYFMGFIRGSIHFNLHLNDPKVSYFLDLDSLANYPPAESKGLYKLN